MRVDLAGKRVLVMGLGLQGGGVEVAKWLVKRHAKVTVTDLRPAGLLRESKAALRGLPITYVLGRHRLADFRAADLVIKNPAVPNNSPYLKAARRAGVPIETDVALFFMECPSSIIGVRGTRGKTTTTALIGEILRLAHRRPIVAGNGRHSPLADLHSTTATRPVVLELSSWQLEGLAKHHLSPHIAVVTNLYPDHLDRHKTMAAYRQAKAGIFTAQTAGDVCVLNRDNPTTRDMGKDVPSMRYWFSIKPFANEQGCFVRQGKIICRRDGREQIVAPITSIALPGRHNLENVLAAVTVAMVLGVPRPAIRRVLRQFSGVAGRLEKIAVQRGVTYYNDTTATMPEATLTAITTLDIVRQKRLILIAGGFNKGLDYTTLAAVMSRRVKAVVLLPGTASRQLKKLLINRGYWAVSEAATMAEAVAQAQQLATAGDSILLSPAASSTGEFRNATERGALFCQAVKRRL